MNRFKFRIGTLMLVIVIVALCVTLVVQQRHFNMELRRSMVDADLARREAEVREVQAQAAAAALQQGVSAQNASPGK